MSNEHDVKIAVHDESISNLKESTFGLRDSIKDLSADISSQGRNINKFLGGAGVVMTVLVFVISGGFYLGKVTIREETATIKKEINASLEKMKLDLSKEIRQEVIYMERGC